MARKNMIIGFVIAMAALLGVYYLQSGDPKLEDLDQDSAEVEEVDSEALSETTADDLEDKPTTKRPQVKATEKNLQGQKQLT